jgi:hypothetical protein
VGKRKMSEKAHVSAVGHKGIMRNEGVKCKELTWPAQLRAPLDETESARRYLQNGKCQRFLAYADHVKEEHT